MLAFNPGVVYRLLSVTPHEDYTAGEIDQPDRVIIRRSVDGMVDGAQIHVLSFLGKTWGTGGPRFRMIAQPFLDQLTAVGKALGSKPAGR